MVDIKTLLKRMQASDSSEYRLVAKAIIDQRFGGLDDDEYSLVAARNIKEAAEAVIETINDNSIEGWK
jgi:hypothetical protein